MRKLKLEIEKLQVESFDTDEAGAAGGTVAGHMQPTTTVQPTHITGSCCDETLALSCIQTNCLNECALFTVSPCV